MKPDKKSITCIIEPIAIQFETASPKKVDQFWMSLRNAADCI